MRLGQRFERLDERVVAWMAGHGIRLLRLALGIVFVWFGALKIVGQSPVADLVAQTVPWIPAHWLVPGLGLVEVAIGLGLIFAFALRLTLLLFWLQLTGTFLVLVLQPGLAFQDGNPLLLSQTGEFVVKNLVLFTAGIVVGSTLRQRQR